MKTRKRKVETYIIEWICEQDGCDGLMENTGQPAVVCDEPKIIHRCDKCDAEVSSVETYPIAKVEYVDEVE